MPTSVTWIWSGIMLCLGIAMIVMALRARFRPRHGRGFRVGIFLMGVAAGCEAVVMLLLVSDFGLPGALARGIAGVLALVAVAMAMVAVFSVPLGLGIPIDLPIPLRWYAWLLPTAAQSTRNREQGRDER
jgi:hypothetical protein